MLQSVVPPTETGLVPIGLPQLAEPAVDADYLFAFAGEVKWPEDRVMGFVNTTEIVEGNDRSLGENEVGEVDDGECDGYLTEVSASCWEPNETSLRSLVQTAKLLPGERLGWWSFQRYDKRKRMRAVSMGAIDDTRTRILLDTGANISVISSAYAKRLRLREVSYHGRSLEVRGIHPEVLETRRRALVKITLGWERVYEFEIWIMEHSAGVDVVLGTDFMIPAGVRLDLFHGTARLPDEVTVPLVKSASTVDDDPYGAQVVGGPTEDLYIPRVPTASEKNLTSDTLVMDKKDQTNDTDGDEVPQGQARVGPIDERVGWDSSVLQTFFCGPMDTQRRTPTQSGYNEWQVLGYTKRRDVTLFQKEEELYDCWLAEQPPTVERKEYMTLARILARPTKASVA
ncbi:hypothetical protein PHMEG_00010808 [Phytophthora megakarya]|uniref:Peptidase A2 domain-containing protein n=1 Tax=Phytophthora megakarya TaxID=4795 RepID=A0A225WCT6_9STRA|nr:hypothetical protein PHMEG_00010808 [Phytophthora megakarya]